jgi:hypothetical protein
MEKYLQRKRELRAEVANALGDAPGTPHKKVALSIAVYLFPELLPVEDFERDQAQEYWVPLERAIERDPRTDTSRQWFEELRANLFNYEGVGRGTKALSAYAETTLHLYEALSGE